MIEYEECPHGRHKGAYCEPCAEDKLARLENGDLLSDDIVGDADQKYFIPSFEEVDDHEIDLSIFDYVDPFDMKSERVEKQEQSGLDAPYYDFPKDIHSAMDLIEWLNLDFAQGNILKSIIRENNPNAQKKTTPIYEAEKQYYYSERRLRALQRNEASGG